MPQAVCQRSLNFMDFEFCILCLSCAAYYTQLQSQRWLQLRLELSGTRRISLALFLAISLLFDKNEFPCLFSHTLSGALIVGSAALIMVLAAKSTSPSLAGLAVSYALQVCDPHFHLQKLSTGSN
jgi:hypothetical protein